MAITLSTINHVDRDGNPSKRLMVETNDGTITIDLGMMEALQLSAALKPSGKNVTLTHGTQQ